MHFGLKYPCRDLDEKEPQLRDEVFVQSFRFLRRGCGVERGPTALAAVPGEGELGNGKNFSLYILKGKIHLSCLVLEHPEVNDLLRQSVSVCSRIPLLNSQQDENALPDGANDLAADFDSGLRNPLQHRLHEKTALRAS